jgi:acyl carrier protein
MSDDEIRDIVLRLLGEVAPEANLQDVAPDRRLRDQLDIDSMDALNFLIAVHEATGVDIPESDYPKLTTLDNIVAYLSARVAPKR